MTTLDVISLSVGILGLFFGIVGAYMAYISFVNPIKRFMKYIRDFRNWEKFQGIKDHLSIYRHVKYPNFRIVIDWDTEVKKDFHEDWMNDAVFLDKKNNALFYVRLEANAMQLESELFISLDGGRYFVPLPKYFAVKNGKKYYYDKRQILLAKIVGAFYRYQNIYEFAQNQSVPIEINEENWSTKRNVNSNTEKRGGE
ncbi:MAG: hypothetical protein AABZ39_11290 [Spirochaetota bacterium]